MEFFEQFISVFFSYLRDLWSPVLVGFLLSGIFFEFIPTKIVEEYLGKKGLKPIFVSSLVGTMLPVCCFGALPLAIAMKKKGAMLGPVLAFLVTTPATSVSALLICWKLLGLAFMLHIFFSVIMMGLIIGILGNFLSVTIKKEPKLANDDCCCHEAVGGEAKYFSKKIKDALVYSFITLPKEIGPSLLLGLLVASFVVTFGPVHEFIRAHLQGVTGYAFGLLLGLVSYTCCTGSVPMVQALIKSGMAYGPAMVCLLAGPITTYGVIFAVKKEFGWPVLGLYLATIFVLSLVSGIIFNVFVSGSIF